MLVEEQACQEAQPLLDRYLEIVEASEPVNEATRSKIMARRNQCDTLAQHSDPSHVKR
jgi:hypothetical protein